MASSPRKSHIGAMIHSSATWPALFIPHGGGPCFFMEDPQGLWTKMSAFLRDIPMALGRVPRAVLVVSAHWREAAPTVHAGTHPGLLFDYYNFPADTYRLTWPAPGAPKLAARVAALLHAAGFEPAMETTRGWDHGVFIPFKLIWPAADVPVAQLSLRQDLDPATHIAIGRALAPLRGEDVLIIGSGMSYHNLGNFFSGRGNADSAAFDAWLDETLRAPAEDRTRRLIAWQEAPGAIACHPEAEHLLPLHVVAGAAGAAAGRRTFHDNILGKAISAFQFG
jgi:aromatic ring-opening dioxygenase catalytic subunit (LigB family)